MICPARAVVAALVFASAFRLCVACCICRTAGECEGARGKLGLKHKLLPGVVAQIGADQACGLSGFATVNRNLNALGAVKATECHAVNLRHARFLHIGRRIAFAIRGIDPRLHRHFLHGQLARIAFCTGRGDAIAMRHDRRIALLRGEGELLNVFDIVQARLAGHN